MRSICCVIAFNLAFLASAFAQEGPKVDSLHPVKKKVAVENSNDNLLTVSPEKYVVSANDALNSGNLDEAKEDIDRAMESPEVNGKPKTLFVKAQIYMSLQTMAKYKALNPYREAAQSLYELVNTKPKYEKAAVDISLLNCAFFYYNDGARAFNNKQYTAAIDYLGNVMKIYKLGDGKRFDGNDAGKQLDTVAANAELTIANSYYAISDYKNAIPMLVTAKNSAITKSPMVYKFLIYSYIKVGDASGEFSTLQEGRAAFPADVMLRNDELNYYIKQGKQDEILKKLEETAASDPNDADIQFNLATAYLATAMPKQGPRPANEAALVEKSENAYKQALRLKPDNAVYNYNFATLYFNLGSEVNTQMNAISGMSKEEQKKYDALKVRRDDLLLKAMPYFEKALALFSPNGKAVQQEDKESYRTALQALRDIYTFQSKMDKVQEVKQKLDSMN